MKNKAAKSSNAILTPCIAFILAVWLLCMCFATVLVAKNVQDGWQDIIDDTVFNDFHQSYISADNPADVDRNRIPLLEKFAKRAIFEGDKAKIAMAFFEDGQQVMESGFLGYVEYWDADQWYSGEMEDYLKWQTEYPDDSVKPAALHHRTQMNLDAFFDYDHPVLDQLRKDRTLDQGAQYYRIIGEFWDRKTFVPISLEACNGVRPGFSGGAFDYRCDICDGIVDHVCTDGDADFICDRCWTEIEHDCIDKDGDDWCDLCYNLMEHDCIDEDGDAWCDLCSDLLEHNCIDEDGDAWCDLCGELLEHNCIDEDGNAWCDLCYNLIEHDCIDEDRDYRCDLCDGQMEHTCVDEDGNHLCNLCHYVMAHACVDEDGDHLCEICMTAMEHDCVDLRFTSMGITDQVGRLDWKVLHSISEYEGNIPATEIFCTGIEYKSSHSLNTYYRNDQALMNVLTDQWDRYSSYGDLQNRSLFKTVIVRTAKQTGGNGVTHEVRAAIGGSPLLIAMKKLILVYLLTSVAAVGLCVWCRMLLDQRLDKPLEQIIDNSKNGMNPISVPYWSRWDDFIQAQKSHVDALQELQKMRQENKRLQTALEYAEDAEINRRQMVSNITHELKTPLAVIHSYCEGLQAGIAPEKQEVYLNVITEETDRMDAMVLEMLDLSRLEAGKVRLAREKVELLGLTQNILDKFQPLLDVKNLSVSFASAEKSTLIADEGRLEQVITNLTSNAIKYSPEGGKIQIRISQRNGFTSFFVENESPPLSDEALEKIWESFYRAEQSRTTKGTGLGLSICKAIVELHRGTCQVRNTSTGVEFGFILPG